MRKSNRIQTEAGLEKMEARELLSGSAAATGGDFQQYMQQQLSSYFNQQRSSSSNMSSSSSSSSNSSNSSYGGMNYGGSQFGGRGRHGFGFGRGFGGFFQGQFQGTFTLGNASNTSSSSEESDSSSDTSEDTSSTTDDGSMDSSDCPPTTSEDTSSEDTSSEDTSSEDTSSDTSTSTSNTGTFSGTFSGSFFGRGFGRRHSSNRSSSSQQSSQQSSSQEENVQYYNGQRYTLSSSKKSNGKKITYENPNAPKGSRKLDYNVLAGTFKAHSPIAFDLDGSGAIETTGASTAKVRSNTAISSTVSFDIDGNGSKENIQWMAGSGDGLLVDDRDGKAANNMDGSRLFGDQGGKYSDGYAKLAQLDKNGDGALTGKELKGLKMWQDNGDAVVQAGEMKDLGDVGVHRVSVVRNDVKDAAGDTLMQSTANRGAKTVLTEDVWFGSPATA